MAVSAVGTSGVVSTATTSSAKELSDQFLQLLVAQLKHQDPLEPLKNEEFVSQLTQLQSLDSTLKIAETNKALLLQSSLATGASMIGGSVTGMVSVDGVRTEKTGVVQSVKVTDGEVFYAIKAADGKQYTMSPDDVLQVAPATTSSQKASVPSSVAARLQKGQ